MLGYQDWDDFLTHMYKSSESNPVISFHLGIDGLKTGDRVYVSWKPDRRCTFRYLGDAKFVVEQAENSKLKAGDTFSATLFILHEPLYLNNLLQNNNQPVPFVVGNRNDLCELEIDR